MKKYIVFLLSFYSFIFSQKVESYKLTKQEISERKLKDITDFPIYRVFEYM